MTQTPQQDLEKAFINRFCTSFNKEFRKTLENAGLRFRVDGDPHGTLKLEMCCHSWEEYRLLKHKQQALRYRTKRLAPPVKQLLIICIPWGERIPTKIQGCFLRTAKVPPPWPGLVVDVESGETSEIVVNEDFLGVAPLDPAQAESFFNSLFNSKGGAA